MRIRSIERLAERLVQNVVVGLCHWVIPMDGTQWKKQKLDRTSCERCLVPSLLMRTLVVKRCRRETAPNDTYEARVGSQRKAAMRNMEALIGTFSQTAFAGLWLNGLVEKHDVTREMPLA